MHGTGARTGATCGIVLDRLGQVPYAAHVPDPAWGCSGNEWVNSNPGVAPVLNYGDPQAGFSPWTMSLTPWPKDTKLFGLRLWILSPASSSVVKGFIYIAVCLLGGNKHLLPPDLLQP